MHCRRSFLDELKTLASIAGKQELIRTDIAEAKADADLKFAFTAMDTFINDVNAVAIGPVVALDAARLGPQLESAAGGTRDGVGIGARLSIVNVLHLTALYSWNPSPQPWESRGAWLMSLTLTDLLRYAKPLAQGFLQEIRRSGAGSASGGPIAASAGKAGRPLRHKEPRKHKRVRDPALRFRGSGDASRRTRRRGAFATLRSGLSS